MYTRAPTTVDEALEMASLLEYDWTESQKTPAPRQQQQNLGQKSWPRKRHFQKNQGGRKFHPQSKKQRNNNNNNNNSNNRQIQYQNRRPQYQQRQQPQQKQLTAASCPKCTTDHPGRPCPRDTGGCLYCGKMGHYIRDCRKKQANDQRRNTSSTSQPTQQRQPATQQQQQPYPPKPANQKVIAGRAYAATIEQVNKAEFT